MKIVCVGRNYAMHAKEMGNEVPKEPLLFLKPETSLLPKNHPFIYPEFTKNLNYEVELVLRINRLGKHIDEKFASKYYDSIGVGIDFTARDLQKINKEKGLPWEKAKAFDHAAPLSEKFIELQNLKNKDEILFRLNKNGERVQEGNSKDMLFSFDRLIAEISKFFTLKIGDLIFTGTPAGVGSVEKGDLLEAYLEDEKLLTVNVK